MKRRSKKYSAYYTYMEPFFEKGKQEDIRQAKLVYRRIYKANWRKEHRKVIKEITTGWNKDEYSIIKTEAKKHKIGITRFIKQATVAYINRRYIPLHKQEINKILQLVALTYNNIEEMGQEERLNVDATKTVKEAINRLEQNVRIVIFSPKTIWQILTETLTETPQLKKDLIPFIESFV